MKFDDLDKKLRVYERAAERLRIRLEYELPMKDEDSALVERITRGEEPLPRAGRARAN